MSNGEIYLRALDIKPLNPVKSREWDATGAMFKATKKRQKTPLKVGDALAKNRRQVGDELATNWRRQTAGGRYFTWARG
jgi:hypothetical protein